MSYFEDDNNAIDGVTSISHTKDFELYQLASLRGVLSQ